ncbi:MAG: DMT family transporter [Proteobacteria bacterium]|nr:DMT family transporter [Pseudomonadota bacterium]
MAVDEPDENLSTTHDSARLRVKILVGLIVVSIAAILGVNLVALKVAIAASDPVTAQALSMIPAIAAMFLYTRIAKEPTRLARKWWPAATGMALSLTVVSTLGIAFGVQRVSAGVAALMISTTPIMALILESIVFRQQRSWHGYAGVAIGFLGVGGVAVIERQIGGDTQLLGILYLLFGAFGWALGLVLMKAAANTAPRSTLLAWTFIIGTPVLIAIGSLTRGLRVDWSWTVALAITYAGVFAKTISFLLQITAVRLGSPVHASLTAFLMPIFGTLAGVLLLGEKIEASQIVAAVPLLVGVGLVLRSSVTIRHLP